MLRTRSATSLAILFVLAAGCTETPASPPMYEDEPSEELESIPGILEAPNLLRSGTALIRLVGMQTALLKGLVGAEVLINGHTDPSDGALIMREFVVLAVDGLPAIDGMLMSNEQGLVIRSSNRDLWLATVPDGLGSHVGKRIWLTTMAGVAIRFGVLEM